MEGAEAGRSRELTTSLTRAMVVHGELVGVKRLPNRPVPESTHPDS